MPGKTEKRPGGFTIGDVAEAFEALIRLTGDCVRMIDLDGRVVRWNPACEDRFGWTAAEVLGEVLPYIPDSQRLRSVAEARAAAAAGRVTEREREELRADGSRLIMRWVVVPLRDEEGLPAGLLSIGRELAADSRLDTRREQIAGLVGDGLTEPLAAILSAGSLLKRPEISSDPHRRLVLAATVAARAAEASAVAGDLQLVAQLAEGSVALDREPTDLGGLMNECVAALPAGRERVQVDFDPLIGPVLADRARLGRAISLLVTAALEQPPAEADVQVSVFEIDGFATVEVRDHGAPVEPGEREEIFERFYSGSEPRGTVRAGLGLYLARSIAEAHGGRVVAVTPAEGGNVLAMRLPIMT